MFTSTDPAYYITEKADSELSFRSNLILLLSLLSNSTDIKLLLMFLGGINHVSADVGKGSTQHVSPLHRFYNLEQQYHYDQTEYDQTLVDHLILDLSILYGYLKQKYRTFESRLDETHRTCDKFVAVSL